MSKKKEKKKNGEKTQKTKTCELPAGASGGSKEHECVSGLFLAQNGL